MAGCLFLCPEGLSLRAFLLRLRGGGLRLDVLLRLRLHYVLNAAAQGLGNLVKLVNVTGEPGPHAPILKGPPGDAATLRQLCPADSLLNAHRVYFGHVVGYLHTSCHCTHLLLLILYPCGWVCQPGKIDTHTGVNLCNIPA